MGAAERFLDDLVDMLAERVAAKLRTSANDAHGPQLLTRAECARALGISIATMDRAIRDGCPKTAIGRAVRFDLAEVRAWMNRNAKRAKRSVAIPTAILRDAGLKKG